jgi:hypothetical protein
MCETALARRRHRGGPRPTRAASHGYCATADGLWRQSREGLVRLTNCDVEIVSVLVDDDGPAREVSYVLEARRDRQVDRLHTKAIGRLGKALATSRIAGLAVMPGQSRHAAAALCLLSDARTVHVRRRLGWQEVDGRWLYVHGEGAIGPDGPEEAVAVDVPLVGYGLPRPATGDDLAGAVDVVHASLQAAPVALTALFGAAFRVVLPAPSPTTNLHLAGAAKGALAGLALAFFGPCPAPLDWSMPATAIERAFAAGSGTVVAVGDPAPPRRPRREAFGLLRSAADRVGRTRAASSGRPAALSEPLALVVSTSDEMPGEDLLSQRARALLVGSGEPWAAGTAERLVEMDRGAHRQAMAAYVAWLARRLGRLGPGELAAQVLRDEAEMAGHFEVAGAHPRTSRSVASLAAGWASWAAFCRDEGGMGADEALRATASALAGLRALAEAQVAWSGTGRT